MNAPERRSPKRRIRVISLVFVLGLITWQVVYTEWQVARLRSQGFTDVVIDSTRNHAYFPLIGGVLGAALFIGIANAIKRALRRRREGAQ